MKTFIVLAALSILSNFVETTEMVANPSTHEALSDSNMDGRIINGYPNELGEIPYIVHLLLSDGTDLFICGGSIIDQEWILTAAHCLINKRNVLISYGSINWKEPLMRHKVEKGNFFIHKDFSKKLKINDIALIKTPVVEFSAFIKKINLPEPKSDQHITGKWVRVSGWGLTTMQSSSSSASKLLLSMDVQVARNSVCRQLEWINLPDTQICTKNRIFESKSTCNGDSGGPMVLNANESLNEAPVLIGIVSFGHMFCAPGHRNVFTRVSKYLQWIENTMDTY